MSCAAGGSFRKDGGDQGKPLLLAVDDPQEELGFGYAEPDRRAGCPEVQELEVPRPGGSGSGIDCRLLLSVEAHDDLRKCTSAQLEAYRIDPCELLTSALMAGNILPIPVCGEALIVRKRLMCVGGVQQITHWEYQC